MNIVIGFTHVTPAHNSNCSHIFADVGSSRKLAAGKDTPSNASKMTAKLERGRKFLSAPV